jgi:hypothetical protein
MNKILRRETWKMWLFSAFKIPMVFWLRPRIVFQSDQEATIFVKLNRRTKNHVNSMYFGAICAGAELVPGVLVLHLFKKQKEKFGFIFKDFNAEFIKRCEGDTYFHCDEGDLIAATIEKARLSGQRENILIHVNATVPSKSPTEIVARFKITLSIKKIKS